MTVALPILLALALTAVRSEDPAYPAGGPKPAARSVVKAAEKRAPIFDEQADGAAQIAAGLARARTDNRRVLVEWGANWCGWCRALQGLFKGDDRIRKELLYEYEIVPVDVGRFDRHLDLLQQFGVDPRTTGIPFLTILDADGTVIANQETFSLEVDDSGRKGHDPARVLDFLVKHRPAYLASEDVFASAVVTAKAQDRRILLHFGAPWCAYCHRFETWLGSAEVQPILAKEFVLAKIDIDRTVGGIELLERYAGTRQTGIPWFAILDPQGAALATSSRPDGTSIGHPSDADEIEHFGAMLSRACRRLGPGDVDLLKRSLEAAREAEKPRSQAKPEGG